MQRNTQCPPPETIAMIAEGKLPRRELEPHVAHIAECVQCTTELKLVRETLAEEALETDSPARMWWIAAAAAVVIVASGVLYWQPRSPLETLTSLAPRSARIVEPRLSGGFAWAPYSGPQRSSGGESETERLKLGGAAGEVIERTAGDPSPEAQHAAGIAFLMIERPADAAARLRAATEKSPDDAGPWSDLAAAQYASALQLQQPSLLPQALASADRAIAIDARHPEALFNRALILERLGLVEPARTAWERYLDVDSASPWATEARARLAALPAVRSDALFRGEVPNLERAAAARDTATVDGIVRRWREQSRAWGEAEFLGRWGEASQRGDAAEAERLLAIARALGDALRRQSGEALLADAVAAIDRSGGSGSLAEAHAIYRRARLAYSRGLPSDAEPDLRRAAALFARAQSPMARMAAYYAANTRFDQNDAPTARAALESLLREERPTHIASSALIRWQLALCHLFDGDAEGAATLLAASAAALRLLDERNHLGFVEGLLADAHLCAGRPDQAWAARIRSFEILSRDGRSNRLFIDLGSAATGERRSGNRETALSLLAIEAEAGRNVDDAVLRANTLARDVVLRTELGDLAGARALLNELSHVAKGISDPQLRAATAAHVELARGAVALPEDPRAAMTILGNALASFRSIGRPALAVESHLLRARAARALSDSGQAGREIDAGIALARQFRVPFAAGGFARGVLDAADDLIAEGIGLSLDRGDASRAFGYAELRRMRFRDSPEPAVDGIAESVRARLDGDTGVLALSVLANESIAFFIDPSGITVSRQPMMHRAVVELAAQAAGGERDAAAALYDRFLRPVSAHRMRTLVVLPDAQLDAVPFAALYDDRSRQYLIEQVRLVLAESTVSPGGTAPQARRANVLSIALPSGPTTASAALAESETEAATIAHLYARRTQLPAAHATFAAFIAAAQHSDVVHLSGHTQRDGDGGTAALDFVGEAGPLQRVPWRAIAAAPLSNVSVVVLAACETLRRPALLTSRAPSLGGAFLEAGAAEAIGTIRPIHDRDARVLFEAIHRELANGASPADAVRRVQLRAIASGSAAWSSIAVLTREIPRRRES